MRKLFQLVIGYILLISLSLIIYSKTLVLLNVPNNLILIALLIITLTIIKIRPKNGGRWYQFKIIITRVRFH